MGDIALDGDAWTDCSTDWRAPFLPASAGAWATYPALEDLFAYNGSGVMPGRTWVIAPDADSLTRRWAALIAAKPERKENLFVPHLRSGKPGDKHVNKVVTKALAGYEPRMKTIAEEAGPCATPQRYAFRSFDRQWIIPDSRVINQPNPELWRAVGVSLSHGTSSTSPQMGPPLP